MNNKNAKWLKKKVWKNAMQIYNTNQEKGDMPLLVSGKADFKAGSTTRDKKNKSMF